MAKFTKHPSSTFIQHLLVTKMGRRPTDTNPSLIEPDFALANASRAKKPRLSQSECAAMATLLSFRTLAPEPSNLEANMMEATAKDKSVNLSADVTATGSSHVTDDEDSICSLQSQVSSTISPSKQGRKQDLLNQGPPPPLRRSMVKPRLPTAKTASAWTSNNNHVMLPPGRPLGSAPGLAKDLIKLTRPICLKLSP